MKNLSIVLFLGLLMGYGFGSVFNPFNEEKKEGPAARELPDFPDAVEVAVPVDAEKLAAAEKERDEALAELAELKAALDEARAEVAGAVAARDKVEEEPERTPEQRRQDWQQRMKERQEKWKEENPEEYEAHQKRMQELRERMDGAVAEKSAFLVNLDTTEMSEEEKKDHEELLGRVAEAWELMNGMQEGKWPSREQWGEIGENMSRIRELYAKERTYVLKQVGRDMGYDDEKAAEFSVYMQDIFDKTSPNLPRGAWGSWGGRRRGGSRGGSQESGSGERQPSPGGGTTTQQ